ncbi:MAG: hypothetical protein ACR2L1_06885 [Pyrinomonadaceae bacterium]
MALIGAFAVLLFEIRFEHQMVLSEHKIAWTPIIYSGLMVLISLAALFFWNAAGGSFYFGLLPSR